MSGLRKIPFILAMIAFAIAILLEFLAACNSMGSTGLAVFDLLVALTVCLIAAPMIITNAVAGRTQGLVTLISAIIILILSVIGLFAAIALLMAMMSSMIFPPAYLATFARFPLGSVAPLLVLALMLKFAFCVLMVLAQQRFLENRGLVVIVAMSIGGSFLLGFLHAFPRIIVYVTDDIGAIILFIITLIRAIGFMLGSLRSIKRATGL